MSICFIAHRGFSGKYLQNTEEAFLKAVEHGSGGIENDVRITKDGVLVVNHDHAAHYADGTDMVISDHTYEELISKPLRNPFTDTDLRVCTFKRYLEICRDGHMVCFIEFKGEFPDEKIHEAFTMAQEMELNLYPCGHYATERYGVMALGEAVAEKFNLPCNFIEMPNPL